jgi:transposase
MLTDIEPDDTVELLFYDEAFFRRETTLTRAWYPRGHVNEVHYPVTFEKIGVCGAVSPHSGKLYSLIFDGFDSDTFVYYLNWLIEQNKTRNKLVLVVDNSSTHKSRKVIDFLEERKELIELLYLPPYSPDLNPVERVWKHMRYHVTHNIYFETLEALENAIVHYLKNHSKPNEELSSLCCIN